MLYLQTQKAHFYAMSNFPRVIGCIDGTHIRIIAPSENSHSYIIRKGYHSINAMAVCDSLGKFIYVSARWPGSCHDSFILRNLRLSFFSSTIFLLTLVFMFWSFFFMSAMLLFAMPNPFTFVITSFHNSFFLSEFLNDNGASITSLLSAYHCSIAPSSSFVKKFVWP